MALITATAPTAAPPAGPARTAFADHRDDAAALAAWRDYLHGSPGFIDLPWDRPWRPGPSDGVPGSVRVPVRPGAVRALAALDPDGRAGWLLALALFAHRFTGQHRIPVAMCAEPPASCCVLAAPAASARAAVRTVAAELARADELPPIGRAAFSALLRRGRPVEGASPFNLGLVLGEAATDLAPIADVVLYAPADSARPVRLGYPRHLLDPDSARRLAAHLGRTISALAQQPDAEPSALDLMSDVEPLPVVAPAVPGRGTSLPERVREIARQTPEAIALCHRGVETGYAALDEAADRLAHLLAGYGVRAGDRVALLLERSAWYVTAELAVLRMGAVAVPLDPSDDDAWIHYMVRDAAPPIVVSDSGLSGRLSRADDPDRRVVLMDRLGEDPGRGPFDGPELRSEDPSHLYYTSGSTGRPHAVAGRHAAVAGLADWAPGAYGMTAHSTVAWASAPGFAISRLEWMPALGLGARIEIADAADTAGPERLRDWLVRRRVTHALLTTSLAEGVWSLDWERPAHLRLLLAVGEPVRRPVPAGLPFTVALSYGSTEAAVVTSTYDAGQGVNTLTVGAQAGTDPRPDAVGRPIPGMRVEVLDEAGRPVPLGAVGRVHVSGFGVAAGLPTTDDSTLVPTGDLGRIWPDGSVDVLGRETDRGWIDGRCVHTKAVERALLTVPGVREAAVQVRRPAVGRSGAVVAAYVVPAPNFAWSPHALLRGVAELLPVHARPSVWIPVDALPRLANGKLDRVRLGGLGASRALLRAGGPIDPREEEGAEKPEPAGTAAGDGWRAWCGPTDWS